MTKLFVEKSRNSSGYRFYDVAIIEGIESDNSNTIKVIAPKNFRSILGRSVLVDKAGWQELKNEAGPPRIPTSQETNGNANNWRDRMIKKFSVRSGI